MKMEQQMCSVGQEKRSRSCWLVFKGLLDSLLSETQFLRWNCASTCLKRLSLQLEVLFFPAPKLRAITSWRTFWFIILLSPSPTSSYNYLTDERQTLRFMQASTVNHTQRQWCIIKIFNNCSQPLDTFTIFISTALVSFLAPTNASLIRW